jgi:hypothetical protein
MVIDSYFLHRRRLISNLFGEEIVKAVGATFAAEGDPSMDQQIEFEGSDEDIRSRFESYILAVLTSVKTTQYLPETQYTTLSSSPPDASSKRICS